MTASPKSAVRRNSTDGPIALSVSRVTVNNPGSKSQWMTTLSIASASGIRASTTENTFRTTGTCPGTWSRTYMRSTSRCHRIAPTPNGAQETTVQHAEERAEVVRGDVQLAQARHCADAREHLARAHGRLVLPDAQEVERKLFDGGGREAVQLRERPRRVAVRVPVVAVDVRVRGGDPERAPRAEADEANARVPARADVCELRERVGREV